MNDHCGQRSSNSNPLGNSKLHFLRNPFRKYDICVQIHLYTYVLFMRDNSVYFQNITKIYVSYCMYTYCAPEEQKHSSSKLNNSK